MFTGIKTFNPIGNFAYRVMEKYADKFCRSNIKSVNWHIERGSKRRIILIAPFF